MPLGPRDFTAPAPSRVDVQAQRLAARPSTPKLRRLALLCARLAYQPTRRGGTLTAPCGRCESRQARAGKTTCARCAEWRRRYDAQREAT